MIAVQTNNDNVSYNITYIKVVTYNVQEYFIYLQVCNDCTLFYIIRFEQLMKAEPVTIGKAIRSAKSPTNNYKGILHYYTLLLRQVCDSYPALIIK